ncbi:hypothetical protein M513_01853 [Trichuris suis]|uniref:Uncharacterized protein n=1 Tax=Trichuris suis TaxID=68888 RepID=A0A085MJE6_9BILA|nr:hypothetical protein M513_01853 [Trichuris suis]
MKPLKLTVYINDLKLSLLRCFAIGNAKLTKLSPFKRCRSINVLFGRSKNLFSTNFLPIVSLRNQLPTSSLRIDQDKWAFFGTTFCYYYYDVDLFEPWYPSPSMNCCYIVLNSTKQ